MPFLEFRLSSTLPAEVLAYNHPAYFVTVHK